MIPSNASSFRSFSILPALTTALAAVGLVSSAHAQKVLGVEVAGNLLVDIDATALPFGTLSAITNAGTLGGFFEARGGAAATPVVGQPNTNATRGIVFDGGDYLQHVASVGGALVPADATLVGPNPTTSIEAWILNPSIPDEETIVAWGYRGGSPDGSNMSFLYGSNPSYGAVGHWGSPDIGWNNAGGAPAPGVWHHLVYTFDGTTQRVYVDGSLTNSENVVLNIHAGTAINIGAQYDNAGGAVTAGLRASSTIARLRIHSEELTATQITNNYSLEKPTFTLGPAVFLTQPQNVTTQELRTVNFSVSLQGEPPIGLEWYRNDSLISGANGTSLSYGPVAAADNNSQFYAVASNFSGGSSFVVTSAVATLTVLSDTNPPVFLTARPLTSRTIELVFSEPISTNDVGNLANYVLAGPTPTPAFTSVSLNALGDRVVLTLDAPLQCELYTVTVSNLRDRSPTPNTITPTSQSLFNNLPQGLIHRYTFNNAPGNAANAIVPDVAGGADGVVKTGTGPTTFTGQRVVLSGGDDTVAPYVDLPNRLLSTNSTNFARSGQVTLEGWVRVTGVQSWSRIFDFGSNLNGELAGPGGGGDRGLDYFFLSAMNGTTPGTRQIDYLNEDPTPGGAWFATYGTTTFGNDFHFTVTWDEATGVIRVYEDGVFKQTITTTVGMNALNDVNVWLGRSNWTVDANMQGEFDEFRMYDRILSTNEIQFNRIGGPDGNFGNLTNLDLVLTTNSLITNIAARVSVLAGFSTAGIQDLAPFGCVRFTSTDSNVAYISADGFIRTGNSGFATLTADFGGFTNSEVVEVSADSIAPTLVAVRANGSRSIELTFSEPVESGTAEEEGNYAVSSLSGSIGISTVQILPDPSKVLITLETPLPCEYITVTVSYVADQSPLFNQIAENSQISFFYFVAPGLQHRYTFNNVATNDGTAAVVEDVVGAAHGLVQGAGSSFTGGRVVLPGGPSGSAAYVDLPNGLLTSNSVQRGGSGQITIEGWVRVTGSRTWGRIFDIGNSGPPPAGPGVEQTGPGGSQEGIDYIMLSAQAGDDINNRRFEIQNRDAGNAGAVTEDHPTAFNQMQQFAVTWDERTGDIRIYENGVLVDSRNTVIPFTAINDVNVWLGRSNWGGDANMQGEFDEFRIYDRVLSEADIANSRVLGADTTFGDITNLNLVLATNMMQAGTTRPVSVVGGFTTAGLQELAASGCLRYSSSASNVAFIDASGVLRAVGAGTANLTVELGGTNDTESITVFADTVVPTLVSLTPRTARTLELVFSEPLTEATAEAIGNYAVSSPSGAIGVSSAELLADPTRVLLTLNSALPCEYITVTVNGVTDQQGNAVAPNSALSFMYYQPTGLQHRYTFNNPPTLGATGVVPDAVGNADGVVLGNGGAFTGTRLRLPGGPSAAAAYVDLPNRLLSTNSANNGGSGRVTLEGWMKVTGVQNWSRVFDFGSTLVGGVGAELFGPGGGGEGRDYFFYSAMNGTTPTDRSIDFRNEDPGGGGALSRTFNVTNFNQDVHFVVMWNESSGVISIYENGMFKTNMVTDDAMSDLNDLNVWLGRSNWTGDQNMQGEFDEFRVYDRLLTTNEIALHGTIGPDNNLGQPLALRVEQTNRVSIGRVLRPISVVDFTSLSNLDLSASGCVIITSSNPSVITNGVLGLQAIGLGTSTLTASFNGFTTNIVTTVIKPMEFRGLTPGSTYNIQVATEVTGPWQTIATRTAEPDGTIEYEDTVPRGPQAFYKAVLAAAP